MVSMQFENNLEDYEDFYTYYLQKTEEGRKWRNRLHLLGQMWYFMGALIIWGFSDSIWIALGVWLLFEIGLFLRTRFRPGFWVAQRNIKKGFRQYTASELESLALPKTLELTKDSLTIRSVEETHSFIWQRVRRIETSSNHIFIHCAMRTLFIVPKRSFLSQGDFDDFAKKLKEASKKSSKAVLPDAGDMIVA